MKFLGIPSSGSIAGVTFSHNRAGQYQRNRRAPVQPIGTGRRAIIKSAFGAASQAWGGLSIANQNAWTAYANEYPVTDRLGQSITLTGQQAFIGIYVSCKNCSITLPTAPPVNNVTFTAAWSTYAPNETTTPAFAPTFPAIPATMYATLSVSQQYGAGVNFNATWWQIGVVAAAATTLNMLIPYVAQFGSLVTGKRIFAKMTPINQYGVQGTPNTVSAIVT